LLAYTLIQTIPGRFREVNQRVNSYEFVIKSDVVFGPVDIVIKILSKDYEELWNAVSTLLGTEGVFKTVTCPVMGGTENLSKEREPCNAYTFVAFGPKAGAEVRDKIRKIRINKNAEVVNAHLIFGQWDYIIESRFQTLQDFAALIQEFQVMPGVLYTTSALCLYT
jgi:hypothetical protein